MRFEENQAFSYIIIPAKREMFRYRMLTKFIGTITEFINSHVMVSSNQFIPVDPLSFLNQTVNYLF